MEEIKSMTDELRGQRGTSLLLGYVLVLAILFGAFEYTTREIKVKEDDAPIYDSNWDDEMIPITQQKEIVAPPPAAAPKVAEIINIVENETELVEEEVQTSEDVNQAVVAATGDGVPTSVVSDGPVGPVRDDTDDDHIYEVVEENAQFPGGEDACLKWLSEHIKYPQRDLDQGLQGRVNVSFVVNRDGSIVDVKILRSPSETMAKEAERVVKMMPKWRPARQGNKSVRSRFILPVTFRIR